MFTVYKYLQSGVRVTYARLFADTGSIPVFAFAGWSSWELARFIP